MSLRIKENLDYCGLAMENDPPFHLRPKWKGLATKNR
jgi:hypothetical protein